MLSVFTVVWVLTTVMMMTDVTFQSTCNTDNLELCSEATRLCGKGTSWDQCIGLCKCRNEQACTTDADHTVQVIRAPFQNRETYYTCRSLSTMDACQSNERAMSGNSENKYKILCKCDKTYQPRSLNDRKFVCQ
nr:conotoxin precursor Cver06 [Conus ebraeus]DAZ86307.1 TPA_inf: conotoxin precursor Cver06 [Conus ebraeus]